MSGKLRLNGATSGYSELQAPDVAGDQTFTLPATGGELATKSGGGSVVGYQQGVWTPTSGGGLNHSNTSWSRIGNLVSINGTLTGQNSGGSGGIDLEGIPYPAAINQTIGSCMSQKMNNPPDSVYISASNSQLRFYQSSANAWYQTIFQDFNQSSSSIYYFASYLTDDTTWVPINGATLS